MVSFTIFIVELRETDRVVSLLIFYDNIFLRPLRVLISKKNCFSISETAEGPHFKKKCFTISENAESSHFEKKNCFSTYETVEGPHFKKNLHIVS